MLLRRIEAYGFKSFADKTEIEFDSGVTAIVGPNGSGKSNISDAIRWALGEQSIRTLRGTKAEDIIFGGSNRRRPMGVAEVSLVFDNIDNVLPIDFNEVIITRRVFRSGESEYYINKSLCRLKDIHELLADTGLGRDSMSVIGQNKVDEVLNSKPEERRALFEEAAGITKYKHRKREALRKMEETTQNLNRVGDLLAEIEVQLEPMAQSAERTRQFLLFQQDLTSCQATLLGYKKSKAEAMVEGARLEIESLTDREIAASSRLMAIEIEKEQATAELTSVDATIALTDAALVERSTEMERLEGRKAVLEERVRQARRSEERNQYELVRLLEQQEEAKQRCASIKSEVEGKSAERLQLDAQLEDLLVHNNEVIRQSTHLARQIETGKEQSFEQLQRLSSARNELRAVEREAERLVLRKGMLQKELEQYNVELQQAKTTSDRIRGEQQELETSKNLLDESWNVLEEKKQQCNQKQQVLEAERLQIADQLQEANSRTRILYQMQQDYEGFSKGIRQLLKTQQTWHKGICGAVAELMEVPEEYVIAVETALGGALQHIVTNDEETAKQAISFLKSGNLGRATFLALNIIKPALPREREVAAASALGALGFASQLVSCSTKYQSVRDYLLGRVIVVPDINTALAIAKKHAFSVRIVTLDGQQINPGGSLTGGSTARRETSFLSRTNEIDALRKKVSDYTSQLQAVKQQQDKIQQELQHIARQQESLQIQRQAWNVRQAEQAIHLEKADGDAIKLQRAICTVRQELQHNQTEYEQLQVQAEACRLNIAAFESHDVESKGQMQFWQQQLVVLQENKDQLAGAITDSKVALASLNQQLESLSVRYRQYEEQLAEMGHQVGKHQAEHTSTVAEITAAEQEISQLVTDKEQQTMQYTALQQNRQASYEKKLNMLGIIQRLERDIRDSRRRHSELQNRLHDMQLMSTKYQYEITQCQEQLEQLKINLDKLDELQREGTPEELARLIKQREADIAALGPVNPAAIEEYERLAERWRFLRQQSDDLTVSHEYLLSIIHDMNTTMSKQFTAAFRVINEKFGEIFARLFGGGHANLELLQPDNVLETGIEISVQPPGKKQQNLALLSGGERALTVIALLFSFLAFRPAPFCVVDEIDAALDEANVQRFSDFLRDYAKHTQFIVVTHRKGTMEASDVMQGVTMEESGVSRLLSVKFMDKAV